VHCPRCQAEYREDMRHCADCGAPLVTGPPEPEPDEPADSRLESVFTTADSSLLAVVSSALTAAGIPFVVQGEGGLRLFPLGPFAIGFRKPVLGARILVPAGEADAARRFLESFEGAPADAAGTEDGSPGTSADEDPS
jgi:hypothetical protein